MMSARVWMAAALLSLIGCGDSSPVQTTGSPAEPNQLLIIRFSAPVAISEAIAHGDSLRLTAMQLQGKFTVGGDTLTDFFLPESGDRQQVIEASWRAAQVQYLDNMLELSAELTRSGSGAYSVANLTEAIARASLPQSVWVLSGRADAATIARARVRFPAAIIESHLGVALSSREAAAQVPATSGWIPAYGTVTTGKHSNSERFVHNSFVFTATEGFADSSTYEHDFFLNNYSESKYGPGTYLSSEELGGITTYRVPKTTYAASNLPSPYLDTRDLDSHSELAYTIGSAYPRAFVNNTTYQTYIATKNGGAEQDNAKLSAQLGHRRPDWCMSTWCSFGLEQHRLIDGDWPIDVPGTHHWSTEALTVSNVTPNPVVGVPLPQRLTLKATGTGLVTGSTVQLAWTGGSRTLDPTNVTFINSRWLEFRVATDVTPDTWTMRVTNPQGQQSNPVTFSVVAPPPPVPSAPTNLKASATTNAVSMSWQDNSSSESGFKVERAEGASAFNQITTAAANAVGYTDHTVAADTRYSYRVRAYNSTGHSDYSNTVELTTPAALPDSFSIGATSSPSNGGSVNGAGSYARGSTVTLTATPNANYSFTRWTENSNEVSTSSTYEFTATANRSLIALFTAISSTPTYTITAASSPDTGGSVSGAGSFAQNDPVTLNATAAARHVFVNWTENGTQVATVNPYKFAAVSNRDVVANFKRDSATTYSIAASVAPDGSGNVVGAGSYAAGDSVRLTATPSMGYAFVNWTENGSPVSSTNPYGFVVTANKALVANFTSNANPSGVAIAIDPTSASIAVNDTKQFSATVTGTTNLEVQWSSNDPSRAGVHPGSGLVTAYGIGTATITVQPKADLTKSASATVTVTASSPKTLAYGYYHTFNVATDGSRVYWVENDNSAGAVRSVSVDSGPVTTLASGLVEPSAILVDANFVYWIERNNGNNGTLKKVPKAGGGITTLVSGLKNAQNYLADDGTWLYFGDRKPEGSGGIIRKVRKTDGAQVTLVDDNLNMTPAIATDGAYVYFHDDRGNIKRVPVSGGAATTIGSGLPYSMVLVGSRLYFSDNGASIRWIPIGGGSATTVASGSSIGALASDGTAVYWMEYTTSGNPKKVALDGGTVFVLGPEANTLGIALSGAYVYWAVNIGQGKIVKASK